MKPLVVANWKMNPNSLVEAKRLFTKVKNLNAVICPPFIYLSHFSGSHRKCKLGAQDCFWEEKGAYTGEISPEMLKNLEVEYVIVGHSERRKYFKESNEMINKKLKAVLKAGLKPILCIDKISQLPKDIGNWKATLRGVPFGSRKIGNLIVAYEPLFAIGTGKPCSPIRAEKMRLAIRAKLKVPILYGGSVDSQNAKDYIKKAKFNGLLVGGASLKPKEFIDLVRSLPPR